MPSIKLNPYLKNTLIYLLPLFGLFSCQGAMTEHHTHNLAAQDSLMNLLAVEEAYRHTVPVPVSFTSEAVVEMESQLDSIFHYLHKRKGFNGTVMITKYDQVVYKGAFGYADLARKEPLRTDMAFQLASVSKQFTGMAIMMLQEEGKLNYDDPVERFFPEFPYPGITVRQLLTHRSGLSNYMYFADELWPDRQVPLTNDDVIGLMAQHQPPIYYQPDTRFNYSNTGYFLLASIVEKASGEKFPEFLQKRIFEPLEMNNTFTYRDSLPAEMVALGHERNRRKRNPDYQDTVLGDKGLYSTLDDLYKWDQALYTEKLVSRETLEEGFAGSRKRKVKNNEDYGFGWRLKDLANGDRVVYHAGLWHGYNTYFLRNPKDHSAIIILSNLSNGSLSFLNDLQDFLYPQVPVHSTVENEPRQENVAEGKGEQQRDA